MSLRKILILLPHIENAYDKIINIYNPMKRDYCNKTKYKNKSTELIKKGRNIQYVNNISHIVKLCGTLYFINH